MPRKTQAELDQAWYETLSPEKRAVFDRNAEELFNKLYRNVDMAEEKVMTLVKDYLTRMPGRRH